MLILGSEGLNYSDLLFEDHGKNFSGANNIILITKSKKRLAWFLAKTKIALLVARRGHVNKNEKKLILGQC